MYIRVCIGQHNDARMNLCIALTAAREGAAVANHVEVVGLIKDQVWQCVLRFFFVMVSLPFSQLSVYNAYYNNNNNNYYYYYYYYYHHHQHHHHHHPLSNFIVI